MPIYKSHVDTLFDQQEEANIAGSFESEELTVSGQQKGDKRKRKKKKATKKVKKQDGIKGFCVSTNETQKT